MTQSDYQGFGGNAFPIVLPDGSDPNVIYDPARSVLADMMTSVINAEHGEAWLKIVDLMGSDHYLARNPEQGLPTLPVGDVLLQAPDPEALQQRLAGWPLLCVYRETETPYHQETLYVRARIQTFGIDWVVGPVDAIDTELFAGIAVAVAGSIANVINDGYHPAYLDSTCATKGLLDWMRVSAQNGPGVAKFLVSDRQIGFFCISLQVQAQERQIKSGQTGLDLVNRFYPAFSRPTPGGMLVPYTGTEFHDNPPE